MPRNIVVGSGISGVLSCLYLLDKGFKNVTLIEQGSQLGGSLKCFDYGEFGKFDHGMHNILMTGDPQIDRLLDPFISAEEWAPLEGNKRDLAGIFWKGKIQTESPYPQVFRLAENEIAQGLQELFPRLKSTVIDGENAAEYFQKRFGNSLANSVFIPIVEKIYQVKASELHYTAASIVPLSRVSLEDNDFSEVVLANENLRAVFAYPQQRNLPLKYSSGRTAYYPKAYGMYRLVDSIRDYLISKGCEILTSSKVVSISKSSNRVKTVKVERINEIFELNVDNLVWSAGQPPLMKVLNLELKLPFQIGQKTYLANLILKDQPMMDDLYYLYVYEAGYSTFRITNYQSYCEGSMRAGGYPVAVEMLSNEKLNSDQIVERALEELVKMSLTLKTNFIWGRGEVLTEGGFPLPSVTNVSSLSNIRDKVASLKLQNLINTGIQSSPNTFFQTDVILDTFIKLENKWK